MSITELKAMSQKLHGLCQQAEQMLAETDTSDPVHQQLVDHLRMLQDLTGDIHKV
ncbi:hypothetical protein [Echinimonas agarilytica]|uniref:Uncharacterized protein n=1 Tax=Echinimonas agarilytica TaxID=1215918 RepID=A0AA42B9G1_9GAMM|nr:hypothetical protein [Echinimonas agarilytica]MCM2681071.1 hypothetical protein [Echinimonas agarilytica]